MVVYRKRHQDWTLPRGKVKDGESFQEAAMRQVLEETGCSCRIGNYLGTISYSDQGVPKVVLFWKMTLVEDKGLADNDEIGQALWLQLPAAIERLTHAQEKALLSRIGSLPRQSQSPAEPAPAPVPTTHAAVVLPRASQPSVVQDHLAQSRLLRECEAFRVELSFLERRNPRADNHWAAEATKRLLPSATSMPNDAMFGVYWDIMWNGLLAAWTGKTVDPQTKRGAEEALNRFRAAIIG